MQADAAAKAEVHDENHDLRKTRGWPFLSFISRAHPFAPNSPSTSRTTRLTVFKLIKIKYDMLAEIEETPS